MSRIFAGTYILLALLFWVTSKLQDSQLLIMNNSYCCIVAAVVHSCDVAAVVLGYFEAPRLLVFDFISATD